MKPRTTKNTILDILAIFTIKVISNCFWEVADSWSYKNEKIARIYDRSIGKEYRKEYETCGIPPTASILHIGCGAYPLTEMVLADCSSGPIVGIDKNLHTVHKAQHVIQQHHLTNHLTIIHGDGLDYPIEQFDVIIVSSCSLPKVKILTHLFEKAKSHSIIIVREVDIAAQEILHCIDAHQDITVEKQVHHNPFPFFEPIGWTTLCLKKR
ncbi:MAG: methyltransferase domain-containing protein [Candidatus Thermoplasmatota archaeon]|nr:methyltransferase domain-containing protein [Candidatus Thermoplasmatota archaeon]